jgi:hypothetical protein
MIASVRTAKWAGILMLSVSNAKHRISRGAPDLGSLKKLATSSFSDKLFAITQNVTDKFGHFRPGMQNIVNALQRMAAMVAYPHIALTRCLNEPFSHEIKVGTDLANTFGNSTTDSVYRITNYV